MHRIYAWAGPLLLVLCAACLTKQVLIRPAVGIANNGDFAKLAGPFGLGPEEGTWESHVPYGEFVYRYIRALRFEYDRDFSNAQFFGFEYFFLKISRGLQRIFRPGPRFDIRWLGGVNSAFYLLAIGVWIYALPARWRFLAGLPLIFIWTDVAYVQYMNSFYMDTAALICLILFVGAGLHLRKKPDSRALVAVMVLAAVSFTVSKSQHAIPALFFIPLFLWLAFSTRDRARRTAWIAGSLLVLGGSTFMLGRFPALYRSQPLYTLIFFRLAPETPDPLQTLQELGLAKSDLPYLHTHAFSRNSGLNDPEWALQFAARCTYPKLLLYYLRHPSMAARLIYENLSDSAARIVPFANRALEDGFFPGARSPHFARWSDFRSDLLQRAPWHAVVFAFLVLAAGVWVLVSSPADRLFAALALVVEIIALCEYGISVLADAAETDRHLFLFHAATDISILLFPALIYKVWAHVGPVGNRQQDAILPH